jgi:hypothetical protein
MVDLREGIEKSCLLGVVQFICLLLALDLALSLNRNYRNRKIREQTGTEISLWYLWVNGKKGNESKRIAEKRETDERGGFPLFYYSPFYWAPD